MAHVYLSRSCRRMQLAVLRDRRQHDTSLGCCPAVFFALRAPDRSE
jgi:hypothetical protein